LKKNLDVPVVWGGVHASVHPQNILEQDWVDFVVQGEGEYALLDLVNALQDGRSVNRIPNIWTKQGNDIVGNKPRPLIRELDTLPFPDKSIYSAVRTDFSLGYRTMASRGCPFSCHYCYNCFYSEKWDPRDYAIDYDPSKSIIEQYSELLLKVPKITTDISVAEGANINSEYSNMAGGLRNCYLIGLRIVVWMTRELLFEN